MDTFYIDESGYTGFDLMNSEQRVQGASAILISDDEASLIIKKYFPKLQAPELKYQIMSKRPSNVAPLLSLQKEVLSQYKCVTYVCDKRYLLMLMFLDHAVEPFYYQRGINFYEDGQNYILASLLYLVGPQTFGKDGIEALLGHFQKALKYKNLESIGELIETIRRLRWQEIPQALGPMAHASPECIDSILTPDINSDATLIVIQALISRLEIMSEGKYLIQHDTSTNLLNYNSLLKQFISHQDNIEFRQSKIASIKFPLKLCDVGQKDSKHSPAIQIADILVGAAVDAANSFLGYRTSINNAQAIFGNYADHQLIHMFPSKDFTAQKEFRRGSQANEVIEYFAKNFRI